MDEKLTPWFPAHVKPVRPGVYERALRYLGVRYSEWTGVQWLDSRPTPKQASKVRTVSALQKSPWRGLAQEPK